MPQPFSHTKLLDISNYLDVPNELLNLPASSDHSILIIGPDLVRREVVPGKGYLERLLKGMVEWCIQEKIIQDQDIIQDLHTLLQNGALVPLAFRIEEYLATKQLKEQCLRAVLSSDNQVRKIHYDLVRIPHRGYIATTYDTCIETAYIQNWHSKFRTFYPSSINQAVQASQKKQPFILKLYGDLHKIDSIKLGHRQLTGLHTEDVREQLRQLLSETPAIFVGFDDADEDFIALQSLVTNGSIVHQINPIGIVEELENNPETLAQKEIFLAVHAPTRPPTRATTTTRKKAIDRPSTSQDTKQENNEETQHDHKIPISVCIYYAPEDEGYKKEIEKLLKGLKTKEGKTYEIDCKSWAMNEPLRPKTDRSDPLLSTKLVILLFSRHFFGSDYYKEERMRNIVKNHQMGELICKPILVGTYKWRGSQFDSLEEEVLPLRDTSIAAWISQGKDEGEVYTKISDGLEFALEKLAGCLPENSDGV